MRSIAALTAGGLLLGSMTCAHAQTLASVTREAVMLAPIARAPGAAARSSTRTDIVGARNGAVAQSSRATTRKRASGAVDTLILTTARPVQSPGYGAVAPAGSVADDGRDMRFVRQWPAAARMDRPAYQVDVTPEAGLGYGSYGGSAEAGATVRLTPAEKDAKLVRKLGKMGIVEGGEAYDDDQGRWYLFAAAKGRAVGLNMANGERAMSTDPVAMVGDAQAGVGWRKGEVQASVGYTRRSLKSRDPYINMIARSRDEMVGLNLSYVPGR